MYFYCLNCIIIKVVKDCTDLVSLKNKSPLLTFWYQDLIPSGISFVQIQNKSGPNTEPWGTPAKTFSQKEVCSFRATRCSSEHK